MNKGVPISPDEIPEKKAEVIPHFVFDIFNELIALNYSSGSAKVYQKDVAKKIGEYQLGHGKDRPSWPITWLNIEEAYRAKGWRVEYDKPAYCESYDAFFMFTKK